MRRIGFAVFLAGLILATSAMAQPSVRIQRVGVLHPGVADQKAPAVIALQEGLRELGYVDGQNIALVYRWGGGKLQTLPDLAADLVRLKVDVLYAAGPQAMRAAMGASARFRLLEVISKATPLRADMSLASHGPAGTSLGSSSIFQT